MMGRPGLVLLCATLLHLPGWAQAAPPIRVLTVGGGPERELNQLSIESNVRYWNRLLPAGIERTTLYADGSLERAIVQVERPPEKLSPGEELLDRIFQQTGWESAYDYQRPQLGSPLDGASSKAAIKRAFARIADEQRTQPGRLLAYFTGHGDKRGFSLWGRNLALGVPELAAELNRLPPTTAVTLIMVQCHAGIFGNLLFPLAGAKPSAPERDVTAFFATLPERPAAGCTPEINEAEYHDFSSYFFAALSGSDRLGRAVTGADFDGDGVVTMHEAFCFTLMHDASIDVPVCSSDLYLMRFARLSEMDAFRTPFRDLLGWASPAQRAALQAMAAAAGTSGDDARLAGILRDTIKRDQALGKEDQSLLLREQALKTRCLRAEKILFQRWPGLARINDSARYEEVRSVATAALDREATQPLWAGLKRSSDELRDRTRAYLQREIAVARSLRLLRLARTVAQTHWLRTQGAPAVLARFERILAAENQPLLPAANGRVP